MYKTNNLVNQYSDFCEEELLVNEHALVAISTFNSYFSVENMKKLFLWTRQNFLTFNVFFMDGASVYNLMAMNYSKKKAFEKTRGHDNNLRNKITKSLINIGFSLEESKEKLILLSDISKNERYIEIYEFCLKNFEENISFRNDCLNATKIMLSSKVSNITNDALYLSVKYLLAELPLWFNTSYILDINSSTFVYKELLYFWRRICYNYNLMSSKQKIMIKSVTQ